MFYYLMIPVCIFLLYQILSLRSLKKHDGVLYPICQIRRDIFALLIKEKIELSEKHYGEALSLLDTVGNTIHYYVPIKSRILNIRRFMENVRRVQKTNEIVNELSSHKQIKQLQERFVVALGLGHIQP